MNLRPFLSLSSVLVVYPFLVSELLLHPAALQLFSPVGKAYHASQYRVMPLLSSLLLFLLLFLLLSLLLALP